MNALSSLRWIVLALLCAGVSLTAQQTGTQQPGSPAAETKSKTPPPGAPWLRDFAAAHRTAIARQKPIFLYSTKTYCPHCVVMERGLLASAELAALYDDVVWLYVYQDFSDSPADRAARRITQRFGLTAYPQHLLIDPHSLQIVGNTERSLATFRAAVESARLAERGPYSDPGTLADIEALVTRIEQGVTPDEAAGLLDHDDILVRFTALVSLAESAPERVAAAADDLLTEPHDPLRFRVLQVLTAHGSARNAAALHELLANPSGSHNPNVLRIHAARALGRCGDADSVAALRPFATSGQLRNSLTGTAVDALVALAAHRPSSKPAVVATLRDAFPPVPDGSDAWLNRMAPRFAKRVHDALQQVSSREEAFPSTYDEAAREQLRQIWQ